MSRSAEDDLRALAALAAQLAAHLGRWRRAPRPGDREEAERLGRVLGRMAAEALEAGGLFGREGR